MNSPSALAWLWLSPTEPDYHCFVIGVDSAGFVIFGDVGYGLAWTPAQGLRRWETPD